MQSTSYIYTIVDLFWENGCKVGQPKITWGMSLETERDQLGMNSWARVKTIANDKWRQCIRAFWPPGMKRLCEVR